MVAINSARAGVVNAVASLDSAGANLSNAFANGGDPSTKAIDQIKARLALRASLATLKTSDTLFKALLDITV